MAHRVAQRTEADLDDIWLYVAKESSSVEIANRLIDTITDRIFTLARFPYMGRSREEDFGPGYRSLSVGEYVIVYCVENEDVLVLRVVHGRRQLEALFGH
jgi:toxin ParE1/3/4